MVVAMADLREEKRKIGRVVQTLRHIFEASISALCAFLLVILIIILAILGSY